MKMSADIFVAAFMDGISTRHKKHWMLQYHPLELVLITVCVNLLLYPLHSTLSLKTLLKTTACRFVLCGFLQEVEIVFSFFFLLLFNFLEIFGLRLDQ